MCVRQNGCGLSVIRENGIKTDEIQSFTKKRNFDRTKYTHYTVTSLTLAIGPRDVSDIVQ